MVTATRLAQGLGESGERLVTDTVLGVLGSVAAAQALASGDRAGLYKVVESYVDAPLVIADPTIFAIDDVLPKPFGGDTETEPTKMNGSIVDNIRADVLIPAVTLSSPGSRMCLGCPRRPITSILFRRSPLRSWLLIPALPPRSRRATASRPPTP